MVGTKLVIAVNTVASSHWGPSKKPWRMHVGLYSEVSSTSSSPLLGKGRPKDVLAL